MHFRSCCLRGLYCPAYFFGLESKQDENLTYGLLALLRGETQQVIIYLGILKVLPRYCSIKAKMQALGPKGHGNPSPPQLSARQIVVHAAKLSASETCSTDVGEAALRALWVHHYQVLLTSSEQEKCGTKKVKG